MLSVVPLAAPLKSVLWRAPDHCYAYSLSSCSTHLDAKRGMTAVSHRWVRCGEQLLPCAHWSHGTAPCPPPPLRRHGRSRAALQLSGPPPCHQHPGRIPDTAIMEQGTSALLQVSMVEGRQLCGSASCLCAVSAQAKHLIRAHHSTPSCNMTDVEGSTQPQECTYVCQADHARMLIGTPAYPHATAYVQTTPYAHI